MRILGKIEVAGFLLCAGMFAYVLITGKVIELKPSVSCTKIDCPPIHPCCNSCRHDGWNTIDNMHRARGLFSRLPEYRADGCGKIDGPARLAAYGFFLGDDFRALRWKAAAGL